ncbi:glycosyltransferase family 2 protein [Vibrio breoganii]
MFEKLTISKSENEIIQGWTYKDRVYVSIVCTTFNQEIYIKDAIESFLSQETKYKFEIIIHDDASTDNTKDIISEYQSKYPSIIKVISQRKNQYNEYVCKPLSNCFDLANGDYIAICEGDDFWTDRKKIDNQLKCLLDTGVDICFTPAYYLFTCGKLSKGVTYEKEMYSLDEVILGGGAFMPTASLLIKKEVIKHLPSWITSAPIGDYVIQVLGSKEGAIKYNNYACVYRVESIGSWSSNIKFYNYSFYKQFKQLLANINSELPKDRSLLFDLVLKRRIENYLHLAIKKKQFILLKQFPLYMAFETKMLIFALSSILFKNIKKLKK